MFGWLKRRGKTTETGTAASAPPAMPAAAPLAPAHATGVTVAASAAAAPAQPSSKGKALAKPPTARLPVPCRASRKDTVVPMGYRDPKPKVGMRALELGPKSRRAGIVTLVHADGRYVVARLLATGAARSYTRQADGTYRLANGAIRKPPRLVLGLT